MKTEDRHQSSEAYNTHTQQQHQIECLLPYRVGAQSGAGTPQDPNCDLCDKEVPQTFKHWVQCRSLSAARRDLIGEDYTALDILTRYPMEAIALARRSLLGARKWTISPRLHTQQQLDDENFKQSVSAAAGFRVFCFFWNKNSQQQVSSFFYRWPESRWRFVRMMMTSLPTHRRRLDWDYDENILDWINSRNKKINKKIACVFRIIFAVVVAEAASSFVGGDSALRDSPRLCFRDDDLDRCCPSLFFVLVTAATFVQNLLIIF